MAINISILEHELFPDLNGHIRCGNSLLGFIYTPKNYGLPLQDQISSRNELNQKYYSEILDQKRDSLSFDEFRVKTISLGIGIQFRECIFRI